MSKSLGVAIYLVAMVSTVVLVDVFIFRNHFWERLMSNIGIILLYIAFYLRFLKN